MVDRTGGDASGAGVAAQAFEVGAEFGGVLVTEVAIFFESLADDAFEFGWNFGMQARGRKGARLRMASKIRPEVSPRKGSDPVAIS